MHHDTSYRYNWDGLEFLVSTKYVDKFKKRNYSIALNVLKIYIKRQKN